MRDGMWDNPTERFLWRLKMDRVQELVCNRARLASMRYNWEEVQKLEKHRPQLQARGLLLSEEVVLASEEQKGKPKDVPERAPAGQKGLRVGQRVEAEAVLGRRRELGRLRAARAREHVHPVVKAWRDGHL